MRHDSIVTPTALPKVALLGRANVGKSTLFNRLTEKQTALTSPVAGTTRDYQEADVAWQNHIFTLVDTGGFDVDKNNQLEQLILRKTKTALAASQAVILVVDGQSGLLPDDKELAAHIRMTTKPVIVAITKLDNAKKWEASVLEFSELGYDKIVPLSGLNGIGTGDLLDAVVELLPPQPQANQGRQEDEPSAVLPAEIRLSIVGQPNVGKSSLINAILGSERQIVSSEAHTTRGAQDIHFHYHNYDVILVDTAGIRRRVNKKGDHLEKSSTGQTLKQIKDSHITLLVLDISRPLSFQDRHLTEHIVKSGNSVMFVANKWDLVPDKDEKTINRFTDYIYNFFPYLTWAPIVFTSAVTKQRTQAMLDLAITIYEERFRRLSDSSLQHFLKKMIKKHPPSRGKGAGHPYVYHLKQTDVDPPSFQVTIKYKKSLHASYLNFLENNLRDEFDFIGTPLRLFITSIK